MRSGGNGPQRNRACLLLQMAFNCFESWCAAAAAGALYFGQVVALHVAVLTSNLTLELTGLQRRLNTEFNSGHTALELNLAFLPFRLNAGQTAAPAI